MWEPDSNNPNLRLGPYQIEELRHSPEEYDRRTLFDMLVCGLHQANHIIQLICATSSSLSLVRGLHSLALLVSTGNYFMRLVFCIVQVVRRWLVIARLPPGNSICFRKNKQRFFSHYIQRTQTKQHIQFTGRDFADQRKILLDMFFPPPLARAGRATKKQRHIALSV